MDIRNQTEKKVFYYIEENHMLAAHDRVVAGVSGGADSVCLLILLLEYAKRVPLALAAVHVDHGIRPDAGEDAGYVEELCRQAEIPFFLTSADVHRQASGWKCSVEDAGRRIRYEAFERAAEQMGGAKVAVAHNSDDNAETMLFHLFRGSGLKGLCGIWPVRTDGGREIIRPLLCLERREIEAYLQERGIPWRTDSTNNGDDYCRNRIRHHILPYAEREVAAGTVGHMCRTAEMLRETEAYLRQQTLEALNACLETGGGADGAGVPQENYVIRIEKFLELHQVLQKRLLLALLKSLSPTGKDISLIHVQDTLSLFREEKNRSIILPFGILARRQYKYVVIERRGQSAQTCPGEVWEGEEIRVPSAEEMGGQPFVCGLGNQGKMEFLVFLAKKDQKLPRNRYTKWFDYDKIREALVVRTRRSGDYLTITDGAGRMAHKFLKDYMITEKIPRQLRSRIPVVAAGSHVLWLAGRRISEYFKVDGETERILQVKIYRDCPGSETEEEYVGTH